MPDAANNFSSALIAGAVFAMALVTSGGAFGMQNPKSDDQSPKETPEAIPVIAAQPAAKPVATAPIIRKPTINPKLAPLVKKGAGVRTPPLRFTGTGKPLTGATLATTTLRTPALAFTGTGAPLIVRIDVGETAVRTPLLQFTGTGSLEP